MTIEEAITDLSIQLEVKHRLGKTNQADAIRLGIEALKFVKRAKIAKPRPFPEGVIKLPGETDE